MATSNTRRNMINFSTIESIFKKIKHIQDEKKSFQTKLIHDGHETEFPILIL